jgi:hypothetical protein
MKAKASQSITAARFSNDFGELRTTKSQALVWACPSAWKWHALTVGN